MIKRFFVGAIIASVLVSGIVGWSFYSAVYLRRSLSAAVVEIDEGSAVNFIASKLAAHGVIGTPKIFSIYVRVMGLEKKLMAGEYEFPQGLSMQNVIQKLASGDVKKYLIQVIEGSTIKDIAKYISQLAFVEKPNQAAEEFLKLTADKTFIDSLGLKDVSSLEGFLFPDTYQVNRPKGAEEIIKRLFSRFQEIYTPEYTVKADKMGLKEKDVVTLASIVEKETGRAEEMPIIAGVFLNRLKQNMALQSDPTVIYGISNFNGNLRREDLANPHPYNTYVRLGLPPGPICSPGKASIEAVLNPANTNYLYFVSKNDGTHVFSATLHEHQKAVAKYQRRSP